MTQQRIEKGSQGDGSTAAEAEIKGAEHVRRWALDYLDPPHLHVIFASCLEARVSEAQDMRQYGEICGIGRKLLFGPRNTLLNGPYELAQCRPGERMTGSEAGIKRTLKRPNWAVQKREFQLPYPLAIETLVLPGIIRAGYEQK